jgi:hypothetical protein
VKVRGSGGARSSGGEWEINRERDRGEEIEKRRTVPRWAREFSRVRPGQKATATQSYTSQKKETSKIPREDQNCTQMEINHKRVYVSAQGKPRNRPQNSYKKDGCSRII